MKNLYKNNPMNAPRLTADKCFVDYDNKYSYRGFVDEAFRYIEDFQMMNPTLWRRFVQQFREKDANYEFGWRGEYWGKMMRGAAFVYAYTKNPELYDILAATVRDMIASERDGGRISAYGLDKEFNGWDLWERKYVLLGMQYFYEVCPDEELKAAIVKSMSTQVDYIRAKIGPESEGKKPINKATRHWRGLNSSSILEPIVRLYTLTGEQRFLDFATYIINEGGTDVVNIFDLAIEDKFKPYQYPVTKAYEMTSCFEGAIEYYRATGEEKYRDAAIKFANKVLETDFTVIGSAGCTHELFDHSTVRQANTTNGEIVQETCVTVTLMKFFYQVYLMTENPKLIDAFETSFYNGYLGAINTEKVVEPTIAAKYPDWCIEPLPFDSYSPLTAGTRGNGIGGLKLMSDNHYYGCCACIGAAGIGLVPKMQLLSTREGFNFNLFIDGEIISTTPAEREIKFTVETAYPKCGEVKIHLGMAEAESFKLKIRIPEWSYNTALTYNGKKVKVTEGYTVIDGEFSDGDEIILSLDMRTKAILPIPYGEEILMNKVVWGANCMIPTYDIEDPIAANHIALRRGPVMLAQENRLGYSVDNPVSIAVGEDGFVDVEICQGKAPYKSIVEAKVPLTNGKKMLVTDYSSAGKLWTEESKMAVWYLTK